MHLERADEINNAQSLNAWCEYSEQVQNTASSILSQSAPTYISIDSPLHDEQLCKSTNICSFEKQDETVARLDCNQQSISEVAYAIGKSAQREAGRLKNASCTGTRLQPILIYFERLHLRDSIKRFETH
ncbi:hypothetical protein FGO68_gene16870 [Halteria grandinella]|uniref:Uncharacterized protein n=1 Tax=Halteria grandinella TaxID=5974 RepID=A0A8J8NHK4_HALGN|nr:hypothetical protein FGO68_gene16870 [Halteria grandinella]